MCLFKAIIVLLMPLNLELSQAITIRLIRKVNVSLSFVKVKDQEVSFYWICHSAYRNNDSAGINEEMLMSHLKLTHSDH